MLQSLHSANMLGQRLLTGSLLIAGLALLAWLDTSYPYCWMAGIRIGPGAIALGVVALLLAPILAVEFARLVAGSGIHTHKWLQITAVWTGIASVTVLAKLDREFDALAISLCCIFGLTILGAIAQAQRRTASGAISSIGSVLIAYAWLGIPLGFWILLRGDRDAWTMAGAILCVKSADIGAYFTGMSIGRHKLIPWLSPGKSWEGLVGGIAASALTGALLAMLSQSESAVNALVEPVNIGYGVVVGAVLGLIGVGGDLLESLFKRCAGAKDSGNCLAGMGGLFDVLDSLLPAGPVAWWLLAR